MLRSSYFETIARCFIVRCFIARWSVAILN